MGRMGTRHRARLAGRPRAGTLGSRRDPPRRRPARIAPRRLASLGRPRFGNPWRRRSASATPDRRCPMSVTRSEPGSRFQEFEGAIEAPVGIEEFLEFAMSHGWGDGLPLVPPTAERVDAFLAANPQYDAEEDLGAVPPRHGVATIRQIAVNAVMAGCRPEYLPVIVTGVRAMLYDQFGLESVQTTTHTVAPLLVMHGPIVEELGANAGVGAFGPGNRAN